MSLPSSGIMLPMRTMISSPTLTSEMFLSSSVSPDLTHTLSTFRLMVRARSSTDFLCVHSSRISPILSMNIIDDAVSVSPRRTETVMAVASRTATSSRLCHSDFTPRAKYCEHFTTQIAARHGAGRNACLSTLRITTPASLS